ncbi:MAG: class I SAM-dependent methyltransferase [bacterium]|nr:class I SAM-dependent methyltransferase [bacterium]
MSNYNSQTVNPYDFLAEKYDELFDFNPFYENISDVEIELFDSYVDTAENGARALDIGCGTGYHTMLLLERGYRATAIDISTPMLSVACRNAGKLAVNADYLPLDANFLNTLKGGYKVAVCLGSTLNHISCWEKLFFDLRDKLEPNGVFIFSFDNIFGIDTLFWLFKRHVSGYQANERIKRFLDNLKASVFSKTFKNDWRLKTPMGIFPLHLGYYSFSEIERMLARNGFAVERRTGVNLATCFVQRILNSSTEVSIGAKGLDEIPGFLIKLDRMLGRLFPSICANTIVVCKAI